MLSHKKDYMQAYILSSNCNEFMFLFFEPNNHTKCL